MGTPQTEFLYGIADSTTPQNQESLDGAISELSLVSIGRPLQSWRYQFVKRVIDVVGAAFLLMVLVVPCFLIAIAIVMTSRGPIFYREIRIGRGGRPFEILKFRSMRQRRKGRKRVEGVHAAHITFRWRTHKDTPDPRVTAVGKFIRRWSIDEVPQLINVLRGEMSLIGPRPVVEAEVEMYGRFRLYYLAATPGLSGLWQVSGRSNVSFGTRAKLDATYVRQWSLRRDFFILLRTVPAVLGRVGAR